MPDVWDTPLVSRLREGGAAMAELDARFAAGDPIAISSTSVLEVVYGLRRRADAGDRSFTRLLTWFRGFLEEGRAEFLPLTARAAAIAGEVRARRPVPPEPERRRARSKAEQRAAWLLDIQIATTAWTSGRDIVTTDRAHFGAIADTIAELAPGAPRLAVLAPP